MTQLSVDIAATQSNSLQASLQLVATKLAAVPLDVLARAISKDTTQASKIRSNQLGVQIDDAVRMLAAAGLKVVSVDKVCVDKARYDAVVVLAVAAMRDPETARRLTADE
jgi:hypothetical protein